MLERIRKFSLSTAFVALTLFLLFLGLKWSSVQARREMIKVVLDLGGTVRYSSNPNVLPDSMSAGTKLWFNNVIEVDLTSTTVTDEQLAGLARFRKLNTLLIGYTNITDSGIQELEHLTELNRLAVERTKITDAGLRHLRNMKRLESLQLDVEHLTPQGVKHLAALDGLRWLDITGIRDEQVELRVLDELPNARMIW